MWCWYAGWLVVVVVVGPSASFWPSTTLSRISRAGVSQVPSFQETVDAIFFSVLEFQQVVSVIIIVMIRRSSCRERFSV